MKQFAQLILLVVAATWGVGTLAATPSVNGANVFAQSTVIDAQGNTWTIVSGVILKNGVRVGNNYNVDLLLEFNQDFYQRNTSNNWYLWTGSTWSPTKDPRIISASATRIGVGANVLVDSAQHVWTLAANEYAYVDGARAAGNYNTVALLYYNNIVYSQNTSNQWYSWNGSAWTQVAGDPTTASTQVASANGATISVGASSLVDAGGATWTLQTNEIAYRNGVRAAANYNTILVLYYNKIIYCENNSGMWYSWSGSAWVMVPGDPRGPILGQYVTYTSPVCPATAPTCVPTFVGNSSITFARATTKGNAIWVAATVSDYGGTHAITVTDSQNNTYVQLDQANDKGPGYQSLAHFYAANILGGADTVTVNWTGDNYKGVIAAELSGVKGTPLVGNAAVIQDGNLAAGMNNIAGPGIAVSASATPALLVALTMDMNGGASDIGGTGFCAVPPGTGSLQVTTLWSWSPTGQPACNLATLETRIVTVPGTVTGSFTTAHTADPYVTVSAVFH